MSVEREPCHSIGEFSECMSVCPSVLYLRVLVYLGVHLGTEKREETHPVSLSEMVLLPTRQMEVLVLHHLSCDEGSSCEAQGLSQNTVCGAQGKTKGC